MGEISAIQTTYKGYRFRSRLEARWAVVLDALEIGWQYEPEGFATSAGGYLPDFRFDVDSVAHYVRGDAGPGGFSTAGAVYGEVKGASLTDIEARKLHAFATDPGPDRWVLLMGEIPDPDSGVVFLEGIGQGFPMTWMLGATRVEAYAGPYTCGLTEDSVRFYAGHFRRKPGVMRGGRLRQHLMLRQALLAGRQARFEHGESPGQRLQTC
jgi:hypothetical protein